MRLEIGSGANVVTLVRAARSDSAVGESIVLIVAPLADPLEWSRVRAAIGPLAVECAPRSRLNAVFVGEGAANPDVEAAITFLGTARSTTGQILDIA